MCWAFLFSWMPYAVVSMWTAYGNGKTVPIRLTVFAVLTAKSSTVINPVIYFLLSKKFRPMLLKTLNFKPQSKTSFEQQECRQLANKWSNDSPINNGMTDISNSMSSASSEAVNIKVHIYKTCLNEVEL